MNENLHHLQGQHVLLGVCGGISVYKSADLVRKLIEAGALVRVVMTNAAREFVTPLTFQALSAHPVHTDLLDPQAEAAMGHIELARWADVILIAPATANTIAKLAQGMADDLLSTVCLASEAPLAVAPAMNRVMWANAATASNIETLKTRGVHILGPGSGDQACGETGAGRMLEPLELRQELSGLLSRNGTRAQPTATDGVLSGVKVVITAGPTQEQLDPVRFLSNNSSGKMGFSVAQSAAALGAEVFLISGPVCMDTPKGVTRINVSSAADMLDAVMAETNDCDIFIAVAAVADYCVAEIADRKIKKNHANMTLQLKRTQDILATVAALPKPPFCVGFAAETNDVEAYAREKLKKKNLHMIAANPVVQNDEVVFGSNTNSLEVFWRDDGHTTIAKAPKQQVADTLLSLIAKQYVKK